MTDNYETLVKLSRMVVGGFSALLEPGREGDDDGEIWIGSDTVFFYGGVGDHIHFGQGLG